MTFENGIIDSLDCCEEKRQALATECCTSSGSRVAKKLVRVMRERNIT